MYVNRELVESRLAVGEPTLILMKSEFSMTTTPSYSTLFSCLYDEQGPIGNLGRGTHYSVFRSVEWFDVIGSPLKKPEIHDFAVIWDEDHDTRIISVIEQIFMAGLLSPIQFIGERKGSLTAIVAAKFYYHNSDEDLAAYTNALHDRVTNAIQDDVWSIGLGVFDRSPGSPHQTDLQGLINAEEHRVITYARNIDSLWNLGTKEFQPTPHTLVTE
jgi:hypothetical protein